jgi:hypothetical protein
MVEHSYSLGDINITLKVIRTVVQGDWDFHAMISFRIGSLKPTTLTCPVATHILDVNSGSNDLYVVQRELRTLRDHFSVDGNHRTAVIIKPIAVAALLIRVQIDSTQLENKY